MIKHHYLNLFDIIWTYDQHFIKHVKIGLGLWPWQGCHHHYGTKASSWPWTRGGGLWWIWSPRQWSAHRSCPLMSTETKSSGLSVSLAPSGSWEVLGMWLCYVLGCVAESASTVLLLCCPLPPEISPSLPNLKFGVSEAEGDLHSGWNWLRQEQPGSAIRSGVLVTLRRDCETGATVALAA